MSVDPDDLAAAAVTLVGAPFRLHGRDPATGLDCIGVLDAALKRCGHEAALPVGYRLRMASLDAWLPDPAGLGFAPWDGPIAAGDVAMQWLGPAQFHLAIAVGSADWVHAHAGLRRVVRTPSLPAGRVIHCWRAVSPN